MTTSAPQWPGQDERRAEEARASERPALRAVPNAAVPHAAPKATQAASQAAPDARNGAPRAVPNGAPDARNGAPHAVPDGLPDVVADGVARRLQPVPGPTAVPGRRPQKQRRPSGRRNRLVVVRDLADRDLWAARRRARANLPPPAAVTRDIALALLEVEAGCRSATQLERIFSPELWEALGHRIGRRGGPLPSGRSLISVRCQEDTPGLADSVAVVQRGDLVRPVALRLDASHGRWVVTELRWWRNETDTATTPVRDGGSS
jgi:Family of unknown function (DUF6459)